MRILIAPDSFKESASAGQVCEAIAAGLRRVVPDADLLCVPMADGGEGTVDAVIAATGAAPVRVQVRGPLGGPIDATYARLRGGRTVVIEMATASGLMLVPPDQRNPGTANTFGTGELIADALESGAQKIVLGIGGSATNDGGAGMAQALGYSFVDSEGRELDPGGLALAHLDRIDSQQKHPVLENVEIVAACDVDNPLCGPQGASQVYGPQKGASPEMVLELDHALAHFAEIVERDIGRSVAEVPGAGAAGGLGAGLLAFAGARLAP
ncbi:MAG: glycerate kinase, partial [Candidatus Hydrogenedentes bacterium]|nr:glycerate kinase [Candidatus Hydrogenedentota bacterium]